MHKPIDILILGGGGREHALAWKAAQSPIAKHIYIAPGNGGTRQCGTNINLPLDDFEGIGDFLATQEIGLVIIGPEVPLVQGMVDYLEDHHPEIPVIGPKASGARLEGSKAFSKQFMARHNIPTATYREFGQHEVGEGLAYLQSHALPIVLKADGLAAGKGVVICEDHSSAAKEFQAMLSGKFGAASARVVVESFLTGIEFSVFALTDGNNYKILPVAKDYKRIGEGDTGLNTGGMGSISPVGFVDEVLMQKVIRRIIEPTINGLHSEQIPYQGFIFFGLINVAGDPFVIEYNCRMGDPETQSVIPRLQNDLVELCLACAHGKLAEHDIKIDPQTAASVVVVSGGYPGSYEKGKIITGVDTNDAGLIIFHAGTKYQQNDLITNGGRVLAVTALALDLKTALDKANEGADQVDFDMAYHRRDIGFDLQ